MDFGMDSRLDLGLRSWLNLRFGFALLKMFDCTRRVLPLGTKLLVRYYNRPARALVLLELSWRGQGMVL